jgi:hypothetical protein
MKSNWVVLFVLLAGAEVLRADSVTAAPPENQSNDGTCEYLFAQCLQEAFNRSLENDRACVKAWCDKVFFFTFCDEEGLSNCSEKAEAVHAAHVRACQRAFADCMGMEVR